MYVCEPETLEVRYDFQSYFLSIYYFIYAYDGNNGGESFSEIIGDEKSSFFGHFLFYNNISEIVYNIVLGTI